MIGSVWHRLGHWIHFKVSPSAARIQSRDPRVDEPWNVRSSFSECMRLQDTVGLLRKRWYWLFIQYYLCIPIKTQFWEEKSPSAIQCLTNSIAFYLGCCQFVVAVAFFFFLVEDEVVESVTAQISPCTTTQVLATGWMPVLSKWRSLHLWAKNLMPRASEYRDPCMVIFWRKLTSSAEARGEEMWRNQGTMADNYAGFIS